MDKKKSVFERLSAIYTLYRSTIVTDSVDECHIELLPRRCHHFTHWSVSVIGMAVYLSSKAFVDVKADIPVKAWQKHSGWDAVKTKWAEMECDSEDELAAICMGSYYTVKVKP